MLNNPATDAVGMSAHSAQAAMNLYTSLARLDGMMDPIAKFNSEHRYPDSPAAVPQSFHCVQ
jgi:hypothetical protein